MRYAGLRLATVYQPQMGTEWRRRSWWTPPPEVLADVDRAKAIPRPVTITVHGLPVHVSTHVREPITQGEGNVQRKHFITLALSIVGMVLVVSALFRRPEGNPRTLCEIKDSNAGEMFVVARYDGLGSGWNLAFFHRDLRQAWRGFYLAHESPLWRDVELQRVSNYVFIQKGAMRVAEYDVASGKFNNLLQRKVYSREEGQVDSRQGPSWWGLQE